MEVALVTEILRVWGVPGGTAAFVLIYYFKNIKSSPVRDPFDELAKVSRDVADIRERIAKMEGIIQALNLYSRE